MKIIFAWDLCPVYLCCLEHHCPIDWGFEQIVLGHPTARLTSNPCVPWGSQLRKQGTMVAEEGQEGGRGGLSQMAMV